jgi:hypothetical protein
LACTGRLRFVQVLLAGLLATTSACGNLYLGDLPDKLDYFTPLLTIHTLGGLFFAEILQKILCYKNKYLRQ